MANNGNIIAGYSGTPLPKKLGIKEGFRVYVKNSPCDYKKLVSPLPERVVLYKRMSSELDIIHFFTKSRKELSSNIEPYFKKIKKNGMIWVSWPKKSSKVPTDIYGRCHSRGDIAIRFGRR